MTLTLASFNSGAAALGLITLVCGGVYKTDEFDLKKKSFQIKVLNRKKKENN